MIVRKAHDVHIRRLDEIGRALLVELRRLGLDYRPLLDVLLLVILQVSLAVTRLTNVLVIRGLSRLLGYAAVVGRLDAHRVACKKRRFFVIRGRL